MTKPLSPIDFVQMYVDSNQGQPKGGHYINAVACRRVALTTKDDPHSRCHMCDAEDILRRGPIDMIRVGQILTDQLAHYTLPANYARPYGSETHADVAKRCGPLLAEALREYLVGGTNV